jgi:predicted alpha/beta-hydrolase family hydrolase
METNQVTFLAGDGRTELEGVWHLPTTRATNGVLIVMHGSSNTKESPLSVEMCLQAADIGLTALRFDFRFVQQQTDPRKFNPFEEGLEDLVGAYNFIQSFGKEMKPKRIYLAGKSLGGLVALAMAQNKAYRDKISGVIVFGLAAHQPGQTQSFLPPGMAKMGSNLLLVHGERDPYGTLEEVEEYCLKSPLSTLIVPVEGAGHGFEPVRQPGEPALDPEEEKALQEENTARAILEAMDWLEEEDSDRDNFRI